MRNASRPLMVMYTTELVVKKMGRPSDSWTMQDYLDGKLELVHETRGAGANDVGMVAWLVELKTVEYPKVSPSFAEFVNVFGISSHLLYRAVKLC